MDPRLLLLLSSALLCAILLSYSDAMPVKTPRQYLPPQPGYIPVYIQDGENPPPDVESFYEETVAGRAQNPTPDKMDTDVVEVPEDTEDVEEERGLRESEVMLVQQLIDSPSEDGVRGVVEEAKV